MPDLKIAFGADDENECVTAVRDYLDSVADVQLVQPSENWPDFSKAVGEKVASGEVRYGVLMCWTGTGTAVAANKVKGARAIQGWDPWIAECARLWNDANILTISLKRTAPDVAVDCVKAFLAVDAIDPAELENIEAVRKL